MLYIFSHCKNYLLNIHLSSIFPSCSVVIWLYLSGTVPALNVPPLCSLHLHKDYWALLEESIHPLRLMPQSHDLQPSCSLTFAPPTDQLSSTLHSSYFKPSTLNQTSYPSTSPLRANRYPYHVYQKKIQAVSNLINILAPNVQINLPTSSPSSLLPNLEISFPPLFSQWHPISLCQRSSYFINDILYFSLVQLALFSAHFSLVSTPIISLKLFCQDSWWCQWTLFSAYLSQE